jgi:tRNA (adenine22-N1)-methyltransferase
MTEQVKLSRRLATIAGLVPTGSRVADIGSDHALLPVFLCQQGKASYAIAGELNDGPYRAAEQQVRNARLTERIAVRQGDGLAVLEPGEADTITIAGMGGSLMVHILTNGKHALQGVRRLILQPNVAEDVVRRWMYEEQWCLNGELILEEDGKIYEILIAERTPDAQAINEQLFAPKLVRGINLSREMLFKLGPYLVEQGSDAFIQKWQLELDKSEMILKQLAKSDAEIAREKEIELQTEAKIIEEVLTCLRKDRP